MRRIWYKPMLPIFSNTSSTLKAIFSFKAIAPSFRGGTKIRRRRKRKIRKQESGSKKVFNLLIFRQNIHSIKKKNTPPKKHVNNGDAHGRTHVSFVNFVLFTRDRTLTNETQLNCFISLSYSLIYIRCVKSYSAKFVRNHSLIRYFLHFDWLLPSTDLKGSFKVALIM